MYMSINYLLIIILFLLFLLFKDIFRKIKSEYFINEISSQVYNDKLETKNIKINNKIITNDLHIKNNLIVKEININDKINEIKKLKE